MSDASTANQAIIIFGMHRSGTSLLASIFSDLGFPPLPDLMPAHPDDNPGGYFESKAVAKINNALLGAESLDWNSPLQMPPNWLQRALNSDLKGQAESLLVKHFSKHTNLLLKDPRICRTWPFWEFIFRALEIPYQSIFLVRKIEPVFASLKRRAENENLRPAAIEDYHHAALLWLRYNLEARQNCKNQNSFTTSYEALTHEPEAILSAMASHLNLDIDLTSCASRIQTPRPLESQKPGAERDIANLLEDVYSFCLGRSSQLNESSFSELNDSDRDIFNPYLATQTKYTPEQKSLYSKALLKHLSGSVHHQQPCPHPLTVDESPPCWIFVTNSPQTRGHIYRVKNPVDALNTQSQMAIWTTLENLDHTIDQAKVIYTLVIHRCPLTLELQNKIQKARSKGAVILFDIDDFLISKDVITHGWSRFLASLGNNEQQIWLDRIEGYRRCALQCDAVLTPTTPLAGSLSDELQLPAIVIPNGFSPENLAIADHASKHSAINSDNLFRLGYASGTPTHDNDFRLMLPALKKTLDDNPHITLTVVGYLDPTLLSDLPQKQIEVRPAVPHIALPSELARFDLNLIPLERNPFCDAKSPLKYFESAMVQVASVCTSNPVYASLISEDTGYLVDSENQWESVLNEAINSSDLKLKACHAKESVEFEFNSGHLAKGLIQKISNLS